MRDAADEEDSGSMCAIGETEFRERIIVELEAEAVGEHGGDAVGEQKGELEEELVGEKGGGGVVAEVGVSTS